MPLEQTIVVDEKTGAKKGVSLDRYDLIPPKALEWLAVVYGKGAQKYAERNWEAGYKWGYSLRAALKHILCFWRGEDLDPESGLPHLAHGIWHLVTLLTFWEFKKGTDDRSKTWE